MTSEEIEDIERARDLPITYDEDSPLLTPEMLKGFRRVHPKQIRPKAIRVKPLEEYCLKAWFDNGYLL